jgi:hypothetical protein
MPFGPVHAPTCFTALMYVMHAEWRALFAERFPKIDESQIQPSPFEATHCATCAWNTSNIDGTVSLF